MLWLCISLPQLPLEALQPEESRILGSRHCCEGKYAWIICCNAAAEARI